MKLTAILLVLSFFSFPIFSQNTFSKTYSASFHDVATSIDVGVDSSIFVCVSSTSFYLGGEDIVVMKLTQNGEIIWSKVIGDATDNNSSHIRATADSGCIVLVTPASILKFDKYGNITWLKQYLNATLTVRDIIQLQDHSYLICGDRCPCAYGELLKLDQNGNIIWQKAVGDLSLGFQFFSIAEFDNRKICVVGFVYGLRQAMIAEFDSVGNLIWLKYSEQTSLPLELVRLNNHSDIIISGSYNFDNYFFLSLDSAGNFKWMKRIGQLSGDDQIAEMKISSDNGIITAGRTNKFGIGSPDFFNGFLLKVDSLGVQKWLFSFGGLLTDIGNSLSIAPNNSILFTGYTDSYGISNSDIFLLKVDSSGISNCTQQIANLGYLVDSITLNTFSAIVADDSIQNSDVNFNIEDAPFTINDVCSIGTNIKNDYSPAEISIFPNPVHTQLTINLESTANEVSIGVYDLQGRMLALPTTFANTQSQLNTTTLPNGFYTLQITNNKTGESEIVKLVKQQ